MLKDILCTYDFLTEAEIDQFISAFTVKTLNKSDFFIKEGDICKEIAYIKSGIFRSYYISEKGEEIISCIKFPDSLMTAYSSFITGRGTFVNMQAITPAVLLVVPKKILDDLSIHKLNWMNFLKVIAEQQYIELEKRTFQLQKDTAIQRYQALLESHPEYIHNIPLQYLASYLGITQRHLSRIRKELTF